MLQKIMIKNNKNLNLYIIKLNYYNIFVLYPINRINNCLLKILLFISSYFWS
jgi:hypothetical protein